MIKSEIKGEIKNAIQLAKAIGIEETLTADQIVDLAKVIIRLRFRNESLTFED